MEDEEASGCCPVCGAIEAMCLGGLPDAGGMVWLRCRDCGIEYRAYVDEPDIDA